MLPSKLTSVRLNAVIFVILGNISQALITLSASSRDWVNLSTVALGRYNGEHAIFLAESKLRTKWRNDVLPIPIDKPTFRVIEECLAQGSLSKSTLLSSCQSLFNRDGTLYDNLPWDWGGEFSKRTAYGRLIGKDVPQRDVGWSSGYDIMCVCIRKDCNASIQEIVIEREDSSPGKLLLGGAVELKRLPDMIKILGETFPRPFSGGEMTIVECTADEAVGLATTLGRSIAIERSLFESASLPSNFTMDGDRMRIDIDIRGELDQIQYQKQSPSISPLQITSASQYSLLGIPEKKAILRNMGIKLPRRRQVAQGKLDELMMPFLDESVRREVLIKQAIEMGDYGKVMEISGNVSERSVIKDALASAYKNNELALAAKLKLRLDVLTEARADITQDEGSYDKYLDADEWYIEQRKRSMR